MSSIISDNIEASQLLTRVLLWLDENNILYCVQRNYAGYPENITGDVDLIVLASQIGKTAEGICNIAGDSGWAIYTHRIWARGAYLGLCKAVFPGRFALTIELFGDARWRGLMYLSAKQIVTGRSRTGIAWRPHPAHQAIITVVHHLLYNGRVPSKYRQEVRGFVLDNQMMFRDDLSLKLGAKTAREVLQGILTERWDDLASNVRKYRLALVASSLKSPFSFLLTMTDGYLSTRRLPEGVSLIIESTTPEVHAPLAEHLLHIADQWHLFLPPLRHILRIGPDDESREKQASLRTAKRALSRGGVVIFQCEDRSNIRLAAEHPAYCIRCETYEYSLVIVDGSHPDQIVSRFPLQDVEYTAYQIWNAVLMDRAQRL